MKEEFKYVDKLRLAIEKEVGEEIGRMIASRIMPTEFDDIETDKLVEMIADDADDAVGRLRGFLPEIIDSAIHRTETLIRYSQRHPREEKYEA